MSEQEETADVAEVTQPITFRGRKIQVKMPAPEQIMVWRRIWAKLESANVDDWSGKEALDAIERTRKIIDTVIADPEDVDWLDDEMLAGKVGIKDAAAIVLDAVQAFNDLRVQDTNRAGRRAAKKAPAQRKAPAAKTTAKKTTARKRGS